MAEQSPGVSGPDLAAGIDISDLPDGGLVTGHVGEDSVLLVRRADEIHAIGSKCTHYGGPLGDGLIVGDTVRCPWHHACFSLRTGEALRAPAFDPVACWKVERRGNRIAVTGKLEPTQRSNAQDVSHPPRQIVIVGGGAAGFAAAEMLRRRGYDGALTMLSADDTPPYDRPNLSKDFLAGQAPDEWLPLKGPEFYRDQEIDLRLQRTAIRLDTGGRTVTMSDGSTVPFDRLLLATGAEPVRLSIPGADQPHVFTLRSESDSRAIIARAAKAKRAVVLGASFIGLEVASALRARGIAVEIVSPEARPLEKILGPELGAFVQSLHEQRGVRFHLNDKPATITERGVTLKRGGTLEADIVVAGIGVKPRTELADAAGLHVDNGVLVDRYLETSAPGVFAAGDIARWPDVRTGENIRVEHWVVAERQGQTAALNMLGLQHPFTAAPFFWSRHYDVSIHYVGHAKAWDRLEIDGDLSARSCVIRYRKNGRLLAVASVGRDIDALRCEAEFEQAGAEFPAAAGARPMTHA